MRKKAIALPKEIICRALVVRPLRGLLRQRQAAHFFAYLVGSFLLCALAGCWWNTSEEPPGPGGRVSPVPTVKPPLPPATIEAGVATAAAIARAKTAVQATWEAPARAFSRRAPSRNDEPDRYQ